MSSSKIQLKISVIFTILLAAASTQAFEFHVTTAQELQAVPANK
jgi:hypothetical protein